MSPVSSNSSIFLFVTVHDGFYSDYNLEIYVITFHVMYTFLAVVAGLNEVFIFLKLQAHNVFNATYEGSLVLNSSV